jgi:hypothetical protein
LIEAWVQLFKIASFKFTQSEYYNPFDKWFAHVIVYVIGIALSILMLIGLVLVIKVLTEKVKAFIASDRNKHWLVTVQENLQPLHFLWLSFLLAFCVYAVFFLRSESRLARSAIVFMFTILTFLLVGLRVLDIPNQWFRKTITQVLCIALIVCSWCTSYYQLFVAFDGGKSFKFPAYDLEWYNYPFFLRPLVHPDDMHTQNPNLDTQLTLLNTKSQS